MDSSASPWDLGVVGFLGLGAMGSGLVRRLSSRGIPLAVFDRTAARSEAVAAEGIRICESPAEAGREATSGIVFTALSNGEAVRSVLFGRQGLARGLSTNGLVIDLSTIGPDESRSIARRLASRQIHFLDAPMGGSVEAAAGGTLLLYVGGESSDFERARPLLERVARRAELLGATGAGSSMKLVNNLVTIGTIALASESLAIADRSGLDRRQVMDLLQSGGARSAMLEAKGKEFLERDYPPRFRLELAIKDLRLVERLARSINQSARLTREVRRLYDEAASAGARDRDFSAVFEAALQRPSSRGHRAPSPASGSGVATPAPPAVSRPEEDRASDREIASR